MRARDALTILDAAYAHEPDDARWLTNVSTAISPHFDRGLGVSAYFVEVGGPGEFRGYGHVGTTAIDIQGMWRAMVATGGPEFLRQIHMRAPFGTSDQPWIVAVRGRGAAVGTLRKHDVGGAAGVIGIGPDGAGIALATFAPPGRATVARPGEGAFWSRVAPHLATAARLRRLLAADPNRTPDAILDRAGRVVHAEEVAQERVVRDALREAAIRLDDARARPATRDADEALALWRCMVEKRWTLVDRFERGGRRYVLAFANAPRARGAAALSARERVVAAAAALGHANKVIAYELDLAESTVATLLSRAARKLGARSRVELVLRMRATGGADAGDERAPRGDPPRLDQP